MAPRRVVRYRPCNKFNYPGLALSSSPGPERNGQ